LHLSARRISTSSSRPGREFSVSFDISTPFRLSFEDAASAVNPPPVAWGPTSASARRRRRRRNERRVFMSVTSARSEVSRGRASRVQRRPPERDRRVPTEFRSGVSRKRRRSTM
jgi:hypothetical protein